MIGASKFKRGVLCVLAILISSSLPTISYALDEGFYSANDILFYDPDSKGTDSCSTSGAPGSSSGSPSGTPDYTGDQIKALMHLPISATWDIADGTVEQWFLQQSSVQQSDTARSGLARGVIPRYGITSENIGEITAVVKAAGVSPVLFYVYTVTEGGGLGGFINHFSNDTGGGAVGNAKRDAEYLVETAASTAFEPAWVDVDNYLDFVPADIQAAGNADFQSMPAGTIGRVYIPSTAATTWEVYYPEGLSGSVNGVQDYGRPLKGMMNAITEMGGDPTKGGASVSPGSGNCKNTVTGEGITKAINFATTIANNDGYGYNQDARESGWTKWQSDPNCTSSCGDFDCSSFVSAALTVGGYFTTNPNLSSGGMADALQTAGFKKVEVSSFETSKDLVAGDVLVGSGHTELYIGNDQMAGAHLDENGKTTGGAAGDQTAKEITVGPYRNNPWISAWRATK